MALEIVHYGHHILHRQGKPVEAFDEALASLKTEMAQTMDAAAGIGLAAQQVGLALRFCVVDLRGVEIDFAYTLDGASPPLELFMPLGLCNPVVEVLEPREKVVYEEGCLSFPDIRGDVERPDRIRCSFREVDGSPHVLECDGLLSRCIQHEVDHLNGVLFIERMRRGVLKKIQPAISQLKARTQKQKAAAHE